MYFCIHKDFWRKILDGKVSLLFNYLITGSTLDYDKYLTKILTISHVSEWQDQ